jgi:hypothetical protein
MAVAAAPGSTLVDVLDPNLTNYVVEADGTLAISIPPQRAVVLVPQAQVVR